jgi:AraC family transcriptional regulator, arabinose operon regulatory protein
MNAVPVRREGFAGQHLVVVPDPVRRASARHPLLRGLLVTDAGFFPKAAGHRVERPQGAATHLLILCLQGGGWARSGSKEEVIGAGECVWLPADTPHAYGAQAEKPWSIVFAHFTGDEVHAWQNELGWPKRLPFSVFRFASRGGATLGLDKVYAALEAGYSLSHLLAASAYLRCVFCASLEAEKTTGAPKSAAERTLSVRDEIVATPARPYRLHELAASAGLSVPHFCLLFRRQTGYAPIDFLIRQRIRRSCRLLDTTDTTISSIAAQCGFDDPYYFSRCFHRVMGTSPRNYRNAVKG